MKINIQWISVTVPSRDVDLSGYKLESYKTDKYWHKKRNEIRFKKNYKRIK
jgi:hypothetical protein